MHLQRMFPKSKQRGVLLNPFLFGVGAPPPPANDPVTDPNFASVVLLMHGAGANNSTVLTDSSASAKTVSVVGSTKVSTTQSKFGGSSINFPAAGSYATIPAGVDFQFGIGSFTMECFVFATAFTNSPRPIYIGQNTVGIAQMYFNTAGVLGVETSNALGGLGTESVPLNTWRHIAISKDGSTVRLFVNGVLSYTHTDTGTLAMPTTVRLSQYADATGFGFSDGYIDEVRITKGVARYTAAFAPPTAPFSETAVFATWNPADKHGNITLSNSNLTASGVSEFASLRATVGKSSGKWYWELTGLSPYYQLHGVGTSAANLGSYAGGADGLSWGYGEAGYKYHNPGTGLFGSTFTTQVIGMALDMDAGTLTPYVNGVSQGVAWTGITGIIFPMASGDTAAQAGAVTANFGASAFAYPVPAGFNSGLF